MSFLQKKLKSCSKPRTSVRTSFANKSNFAYDSHTKQVSEAKTSKASKASVFFSPVNIKSAREPRFLEDIHGHFFGFTGTFFRKFTGKWLRSRALFWTFSRALFRVSRAKKLKCSRTLLEVHGHILKFKVLCSRAPANVHGHFCQKKLNLF